MHDARNPSFTWNVPLANMFEVLSKDVEIRALQIDVNFKGAGRITIDSWSCGVRAAQDVKTSVKRYGGHVKGCGANSLSSLHLLTL